VDDVERSAPEVRNFLPEAFQSFVADEALLESEIVSSRDVFLASDECEAIYKCRRLDSNR